MRQFLPTRTFLLFALLALPLSALAATLAGHVKGLQGDVYGQAPGGNARKLGSGAEIYIGDDIRTAEGANVEVEFLDKSRFNLGSAARMQVANFSYRPGAEDNISQTKILKGVFRFFSGLIAKQRPQAMTVGTTVATIGIRGTQVAGEVNDESAEIALLDPEDVSGFYAIEVSNEYGSVVIDKPNYGTVIPDAKSPPSPPRPMQAKRIDTMLRQITTIRRLTVPKPPPRLP